MKIRTGFVSNSSSSSFIAVLTKRQFESIDFSPEERASIDELFVKESQLDGNELIMIHSVSGNIDDVDYLDVNKFKESVIKYARKSGSNLAEYENEDHFFFQDLFSESCYELRKRLSSLEKEGKCMTYKAEF